MGFWSKVCCCGDNKEFDIEDENRILPKLKSDSSSIQKYESPYTIFAYGLVPPDLQMLKIPMEFCREGITKISCGAEHFMMLTENNYLLAAGNNTYGQCARDPDKPLTRDFAKYHEESSEKLDKETPKFIRLKAFNIPNSKIIDIATGSYHSLVLLKEDNSRISGIPYTVMAFGHETGCGFSDRKHSHIPSEIYSRSKFNENVKHIYAGQMRSTLVLESGKILMIGEWFNGSKQRELKEVHLNLENDDSIKRIAIGKMHALICTTKGKLFAIGDNTYGEIGFSRDVSSKQIPTQIPFFNDLNVIDVACGARHSLVLEETGNIFAFGDNSEEQCGVEVNRAYEPYKIETKGMLGEQDVLTRFIYCGDSHSALVTSEGDLFAWGDNTAGRLGIKGGLSVFRPRLVDEIIGRNLCDVALGGFFSVFIVGPKNGSILDKNENIIKSRVLTSLLTSDM